MLRLQTPLPERYTDATPDELDAADRARPRPRSATGVFILGHHYQRDEVIRWADARGDSFRLSVLAQEHPEAEYIVFCGVHFMAESADVLTADHQQVILPDLNAGCSMADMADIDAGRGGLGGAGRGHRHRPPRADHLHELVGRAEGVRRPARRRRVHVDQRPGRARVGARPSGGDKVLFFPDQHLGRNTGFAMGYDRRRHAGVEPAPRARRARPSADCKDATFLLWKGHCSVHQRFRPEHVDGVPRRAPRRHRHRPPRVRARRRASSPTRSARPTSSSRRSTPRPPGSVIGVGTEIHLVQRLAAEHPDKTSSRSTRSSARARRCSASTPRTWRGCSRSSSRARSSTRSPSTPTPPSGPRSRPATDARHHVTQPEGGPAASRLRRLPP